MGVLNKRIRVLLVEDNPGDVDLVREYIERDPESRIDLVNVPTLSAAREAITGDATDLVLLDLGLPDGRGIEVVGAMREMASQIPIVVLTGHSDAAWALEAIRRDAQDYLLKDQLDAAVLHRSIRYAIERHRSQRQYRQQLGVSPDGVLVIDHQGAVRFVNASAESLLGASPQRVDELPEKIRLAQDEASGVRLATGRIVDVRKVETIWDQQPACLVSLHDCTERYVAEEALGRLTEELTLANRRLGELVATDPLTEVLNRRGIEEALDKELARMHRTGDDLIAVLIDYDDFKRINESYGHAVGDATLRALTASVRNQLRSGDYLARVGGDEFLILLPGTNPQLGVVVADKVRKAIKATTLPVADGQLTLSASLAVARVGPHVVSLEEVLSAAAPGLRRSKRSGKDQVANVEHRVDDASDSVPTIDVATMTLSTWLQEIRELESDTVVGYEALTRGPPGALTMPVELFRSAFERDLLTTLDLRALAGSLTVLRDDLVDGWFHVNVFPSTLMNTPIERIVAMLVESGRGEDVCVELSEQQFLGDPSYLSGVLTELRREGIRIALDDVGYGRSSIEALIVLEPDVVKIDRTCVRSIDAHPRERRQLERLISMIEINGAITVVEGVETEEELGVLREMGVQYCQGYLWGQPRPARSG